MATVAPLASISLTARKVVAVNEDTAAYVSGNCVAFLSLSTNSTTFLPTADEVKGDDRALYGVAAIAASTAGQKFAVAPRSLDPVVHVYSYPSLELQTTIRVEPSAEIADIAFSGDGKRIATIGSLPDFALCIWDLSTGALVAQAKLPVPATQVSFNPLKPQQLCTTGPKGLCVWNLFDSFGDCSLEGQKLFIKAVDEDMSDDEHDSDVDEEDEGEAEEAQGPRNDFVCHTWGVSGHIHAATRAGDMYTLTASGAQVLDTFPTIYAMGEGGVESDAKLICQSMFPTKSHLICVHSDGKVRWIAPQNFDVQRTLNLADSGDATAVDSLDGGAGEDIAPQWVVPVSCAITPGFSTLLTITTDGMLLSLTVGSADVDADDDVDLDADSAPRVVLDVHADAVYALAAVNTMKSTILTSAADGSVRIWDTTRGTLVHKERFASDPFVCAHSAPRAPVVAMGSVSGGLYLAVVQRRPVGHADGSSVTFVRHFKLFDKATTQVQFHPRQPLLAAASMADGRVYILDTRAKSGVRVVATVTLPAGSQPFAMAWAGGAKSTKLFISTSDARLLVCESCAASADIDEDSLRTQPLATAEVASFGSRAALSLSMMGDGSTQSMFVVLEGSKALHQYSVDTSTSTPQVEPAGRFHKHEREIISIAKFSTTAASTLLVTGAKDGSVAIWQVTKSDGGHHEVSLASTVRGHAAAVIRLSFTNDGSRLVSTALDGSIIMWQIAADGPPVRVDESAPVAGKPFLALQMPDELQTDSLMTRLDRAAARRRAVEDQKAKDKRLEAVQLLRDELNALYAHNDRVEDIERLEPEDFIIDVEEKERLEKDGDERAEQVRREINLENMGRDVIRQRLMDELWNSMDVHGKELRPIKEGMKVNNFPIPVVSEAEQVIYEKVVMQRRIEMREVRQNFQLPVWPGTSNELHRSIISKINWIVNEGKLSPSVEYKDPNADADDDGGANAQDEENDGAGDDLGHDPGGDSEVRQREETLVEMLYRPLSLRTPAQKRRQIVLLKRLIREMKMAFNKKFEETFAFKEEKIDEIRNKNNRIMEILEELKADEEFFKPKWHDNEFPERVINVSDAEIPVEKYISEAERKRLAEEEEERRRREAENQEDNAPQRALMEMMSGTLEVQTDLNMLEQELVREEWMDELLFEEMSDEQKKKLEEFEATQKALLEEKEKYRKGLELELKKLRTDVADICRITDERINELFNLKIKTQQQIYVQELYSLRLALVIMEREDDLRQLQKLREQIQEVQKKHQEKSTSMNNFLQQIASKRAEVEAMKSEEKSMDRNFKRTMQDMSETGVVDSETMAVLMSLYKSRPISGASEGGAADTRNSLYHGTSVVASSASGTSGMGAALADVQAGMDSVMVPPTNPFFELRVAMEARTPAKKRAATRKKMMQPLDLENEVPEGFEVPMEMMQKLQEMRLARISFELDINFKTEEVDEMVQHQKRMEQQCSVLNSELASFQELRSELNERLAISGSNLEILARIKQGRDEVEQEAVVTDYADAVLLPSSFVAELNARIKELGADKVGVLTKIKDFNKEINTLLWECKYLKMMVRHTEEKYLDYHMLRVTKDLQAFLKGGSGADRQRLNLEKAEATYEYMKRAHLVKMQKLEKDRRKLQKHERQKVDENERLRKHVEDLERNVSLRASIHRARSSGTGVADAGAATRQRMKQIVTRSKLIDLARAQTDEIEFLRQELDRLRQRTFPSFALRRGTPDEY